MKNFLLKVTPLITLLQLALNDGPFADEIKGEKTITIIDTTTQTTTETELQLSAQQRFIERMLSYFHEIEIIADNANESPKLAELQKIMDERRKKNEELSKNLNQKNKKRKPVTLLDAMEQLHNINSKKNEKWEKKYEYDGLLTFDSIYENRGSEDEQDQQYFRELSRLYRIIEYYKIPANTLMMNFNLVKSATGGFEVENNNRVDQLQLFLDRLALAIDLSRYPSNQKESEILIQLLQSNMTTEPDRKKNRDLAQEWSYRYLLSTISKNTDIVDSFCLESISILGEPNAPGQLKCLGKIVTFYIFPNTDTDRELVSTLNSEYYTQSVIARSQNMYETDIALNFLSAVKSWFNCSLQTAFEKIYSVTSPLSGNHTDYELMKRVTELIISIKDYCGTRCTILGDDFINTIISTLREVKYDCEVAKELFVTVIEKICSANNKVQEIPKDKIQKNVENKGQNVTKDKIQKDIESKGKMITENKVENNIEINIQENAKNEYSTIIKASELASGINDYAPLFDDLTSCNKLKQNKLSKDEKTEIKKKIKESLKNEYAKIIVDFAKELCKNKRITYDPNLTIENLTDEKNLDRFEKLVDSCLDNGLLPLEEFKRCLYLCYFYRHDRIEELAKDHIINKVRHSITNPIEDTLRPQIEQNVRNDKTMQPKITQYEESLKKYESATEQRRKRMKKPLDPVKAKVAQRLAEILEKSSNEIESETQETIEKQNLLHSFQLIVQVVKFTMIMFDGEFGKNKKMDAWTNRLLNCFYHGKFLQVLGVGTESVSIDCDGGPKEFRDCRETIRLFSNKLYSNAYGDTVLELVETLLSNQINKSALKPALVNDILDTICNFDERSKCGGLTHSVLLQIVNNAQNLGKWNSWKMLLAGVVKCYNKILDVDKITDELKQDYNVFKQIVPQTTQMLSDAFDKCKLEYNKVSTVFEPCVDDCIRYVE